MSLDVNKHVQVPGRHTGCRFPFSTKAQSGPIVYPWGDVDGDLFFVDFNAFPSAGGAGVFDDLPGAVAMRAGAG